MRALPLALPRLGRAEARDARARSAPRAPLNIPGSDWSVAVDAGGKACGPAALRIDLVWGEHALAVLCPGEAVDAAVGRLAPGVAATDRPSDLAALLVEAALLPALTAVERDTGRDIRVVGAAPEPAPALDAALALSVGGGGRRWGLRVEGPPAALDDLLSAWPVAPRAMESLPFPATLRIGHTRLALRAVRSLRPGDAVIVETGGGGRGMLVVAGAWQAGACRHAAGWTLESRLRPMGPQDDGEWPMRDDGGKDDEDGDEAGPIGDADELPVRLTFDVGRMDIALGELRRLGAGSVLELGRDTGEPVRISANGRLVGQGMLVDVDGRLGVRIERIFDHG